MAKSRPGKHRFVYGPVPSRRLGLSLGVDVIPRKSCTLDCVYCQLGRTGRTLLRRRAYYPVDAVLAEVRKALESGRRIDTVTFSGSGEPTLNKNLGELIRGIKAMTGLPVTVLTNGTLLSRADVRHDLLAADLVVPSLDAASPALFRKVNRPHLRLSFAEVLQGLIAFRREFKGRLWLEIMLVKGLNDSPAHIRRLKAAASALDPDKIQLNTVVRPPADRSARPLSPAELERVRRLLGPKAEVIAAFPRRRGGQGRGSLEDEIGEVIKRRPVTAGDITTALGRPAAAVAEALRKLVASGRARAVRHGRKTFFES